MAGNFFKFVPLLKASPSSALLPQCGMLGLGYFSYAMFLLIFLMAANKSRANLKRKLLLVWEQSDGGSMRQSIRYMLLCGVLIFTGQVFLTLSALINPADSGIAVAIFSTAGIVLAVACRILYNELLSIRQMIGMSIATVGVAFMVVSTAVESTTGYVAPLFALCVTTCFAVSQLVEKLATARKVGRMGVAALSFSSGICGIVLLIVQLSLHGHLGITGYYAFCSWFAGVLSASIAGFRNVAFARGGPAGLIAAIGQANPAIIVLANWAIFNLVPGKFPLVGMGITTVGMVYISLNAQKKLVSRKATIKAAAMAVIASDFDILPEETVVATGDPSSSLTAASTPTSSAIETAHITPSEHTNPNGKATDFAPLADVV
jgi:drug/metabolite transporter (DMT)-like permease